MIDVELDPISISRSLRRVPASRFAREGRLRFCGGAGLRCFESNTGVFTSPTLSYAQHSTFRARADPPAEIKNAPSPKPAQRSSEQSQG